MLRDLLVSAIITFLAIAPMLFAAWYDGRSNLDTQR
jgi:hypothetical protein